MVLNDLHSLEYSQFCQSSYNTFDLQSDCDIYGMNEGVVRMESRCYVVAGYAVSKLE